MKNTERQDQIAEYVQQQGYVTFAELKARFGYSDMTLRNDLKTLDAQNRIIRVHGGAKSAQTVVRSDDLFFTRSIRHADKKREIARKAQALVQPNMSIFMDCGTTTMELCRKFPDVPCFIVTNSISSILELAHLKNPSVMMLGGQLNRYNLCVDSLRNQPNLEKMNFDIMFLAVTGFTMENGFTCGTEVEDILRQTVMHRSGKVVALMDSSKVGQVYAVTYAGFSDVDVVISDSALDPETAAAFRSHGVEVL